MLRIDTAPLATPVSVANGGTGTSTQFTAGSVVFAGTNGVYTQNNANFYWDNSNNKLSIGTQTGNGRFTIRQLNAFTRTSGFNLITNDTFRNVSIFFDGNNNVAFDSNTPNASIVLNPTGGKVGIGNVVPTGLLHIVSGNNAKATIYAVGGTASTDWAQLLFGEDLTTNYAEIIRYSNASTLAGRFDIVNRTSSHILSIGATDTLSYLYGSAGATLLIGMGTQSPAATVHVKGGDDQIHHIIQANSTQTADIAQIRNSAGTVLDNFGPTGKMGINQSTLTGMLNVKSNANATTGLILEANSATQANGGYYLTALNPTNSNRMFSVAPTEGNTCIGSFAQTYDAVTTNTTTLTLAPVGSYRGLAIYQQASPTANPFEHYVANVLYSFFDANSQLTVGKNTGGNSHFGGTGSGISCYDTIDVAPGASGYATVNIYKTAGGNRAASFGMSLPGVAATDDLYFGNWDGTWRTGLIIKNSAGDMIRPLASTTQRGLLITEAGTQTANIIEIQNSSSQKAFEITGGHKLGWTDNAGGATDTNLYRSVVTNPVLTTDNRVEINVSNTNHVTTNGANAHLFINNPSSVGQTSIHMEINGALGAKWRTDYQNNVNWIAGSSGSHIFYTGGDNGTGTPRFKILTAGQASLGDNTDQNTGINGQFHITTNDVNRPNLWLQAIASMNAPFIQCRNSADSVILGEFTNAGGGYFGQGAFSKASWTTTGIQLATGNPTFTDTSAGGTVATQALNSFASATVAASNSRTFTDSATVYIADKPTAGTNVTQTNAWALWVDAGNVRFDGNLRVDGLANVKAGNATSEVGNVGGSIDFSTTQAGNTAATETSLYSYSVPANTLNTNGDSVEFWAAGTFSNTLNVDKRVIVKFGATEIFNSGPLGPISQSWTLQGQIIRTGAATQKAAVEFESSDVTNAPSISKYTTTAETLSGAVTFDIRGNGTGASDVVFEMGKIFWQSA